MTSPPIKLPPTGQSLLDALAAAGGSVGYGDPCVTISGLTALRHRGLARIENYYGKSPPRVVLTDAGRAAVEAGR